MHDQNKNAINALENLNIDYIITGETALDFFKSNNDVMYDSFEFISSKEEVGKIRDSVVVESEDDKKILFQYGGYLFISYLEYYGYSYSNTPKKIIDGVEVINPKTLLDILFNSEKSKLLEEQIAHLAFIIYFDDMTEEQRQAVYRHSRI